MAPVAMTSRAAGVVLCLAVAACGSGRDVPDRSASSAPDATADAMADAAADAMAASADSAPSEFDAVAMTAPDGANADASPGSTPPVVFCDADASTDGGGDAGAGACPLPRSVCDGYY